MRSKHSFKLTTSFLIVLHLLSFSSSSHAAPEAQWRGNNRDGVYEDQGLLKKWPEEGPKLIWSQTGIGHGWSSVVAANETLFVTGTQDTMDHISALSKAGKILWQIPFARVWDKSFPEARCTPTVESGKVYLISSLGKVMRIDSASAQIDWQQNAYAQFEGDHGVWGTSESPLLVLDFRKPAHYTEKTTVPFRRGFVSDNKLSNQADALICLETNHV